MSNCQCRKSQSRPENTSTEYQTCVTVTGSYEHGNHHLARAALRPDGRGLVVRTGLSVLTLPDTDAPIIVDSPGPRTPTRLRALRTTQPWWTVTGVRTLDEIMGIEGACSNAYFDALSACVPADVTFDGRSRRTPRDLPNAALSYGYAILLAECVGALHAAGLEPSISFAHAPTDKRPSLALDLMEQFRLLLVDQTVMALLRTRKLRPEHGVVDAEAGGVWLGGDGKKILVDAYEAACQRSVTCALPGYSGSWCRHIAHSVQMLARVRSSLAALISDADDVIHIYPICSSCADRADILGAAIALDDVGLCRGV